MGKASSKSPKLSKLTETSNPKYQSSINQKSSDSNKSTSETGNRRWFRIYIQHKKFNKILIEIDSKSTIWDLKGKICENQGKNFGKIFLKGGFFDSQISGYRQKLIQQGRDIGDGTKTLEEYKIPNEAILELELQDRIIQIKGINKPIWATCEMLLTKKIGQLKNEISEKLNIPVSRMRLVFAGKALSEDEKTMDDYLFEGEATVIIILSNNIK